jgi:hypothetical protein
MFAYMDSGKGGNRTGDFFKSIAVASSYSKR